MVDPITMGAVAIGGTIAGGVIGGLGAEEAGQAQQNMYNYKAGVALINKQVNQQNASWALQAGETQAEEKGLQARQQIGQQKVVQAASGFEVNSGTNAKVRQDMTDVAAFDQNVIRWDASKTAYGYQIKAATDQAESNLDIMAGQQAKEAGDIGEISSFINAGTSVASKWYQGKSTGVWG